MRLHLRGLATFGVALVLAACGGGTATNAPATAGPAATSGSVAGAFPFHCSFHPSMKGTITIT